MKNRLETINKFLRRAGFGIHHTSSRYFERSIIKKIDELRLLDPSDKRIEGFFVDECQIAHLARLFARFRPDILIDVGANEGQFATLARNAGYEGKIVSIEPNPDAFSKLQNLHPENDKKVNIQGAVGCVKESVEFPISNSSEFSSFHKPSMFGVQAFGVYMATDRTVACEVRPLPDWLSPTEISDTTTIFIKTDTQGHDLEVLTSAEKLIKNTAVICTELSLESLYEGAPSHHQMEKYLSNLGFYPSGYYTVCRPSNGERLIEIDAVFVNKAMES